MSIQGNQSASRKEDLTAARQLRARACDRDAAATVAAVPNCVPTASTLCGGCRASAAVAAGSRRGSPPCTATTVARAACAQADAIVATASDAALTPFGTRTVRSSPSLDVAAGVCVAVATTLTDGAAALTSAALHRSRRPCSSPVVSAPQRTVQVSAWRRRALRRRDQAAGAGRRVAAPLRRRSRRPQLRSATPRRRRCRCEQRLADRYRHPRGRRTAHDNRAVDARGEPAGSRPAVTTPAAKTPAERSKRGLLGTGLLAGGEDPGTGRRGAERLRAAHTPRPRPIRPATGRPSTRATRAGAQEGARGAQPPPGGTSAWARHPTQYATTPCLRAGADGGYPRRRSARACAAASIIGQTRSNACSSSGEANKTGPTLLSRLGRLRFPHTGPADHGCTRSGVATHAFEEHDVREHHPAAIDAHGVAAVLVGGIRREKADVANAGERSRCGAHGCKDRAYSITCTPTGRSSLQSWQVHSSLHAQLACPATDRHQPAGRRHGYVLGR